MKTIEKDIILYELSFENDLANKIINETPWRQDTINIYGRTYNIPRLQQWYGDSNTQYSYSGILLNPLEWTDRLSKIKSIIESKTNLSYNSVLINYYRDGNDTVGWHSDDEPEIYGPIASLSLGVSRDFMFRRKNDYMDKLKILLNHGNLILMLGDVQKDWEHCLPRRKKCYEERINLTFRNINPY